MSVALGKLAEQGLLIRQDHEWLILQAPGAPLSASERRIKPPGRAEFLLASRAESAVEPPVSR